MSSDRIRYRLGLRASNAARPYKNRYRESKAGEGPWLAEDFRDATVGEDFDEGERDEDRDSLSGS